MYKDERWAPGFLARLEGSIVVPKYQSQIGGVSDEVTGREILEILGPSPSREDAVDRQNMRFTDLPVKKWLQLYVPFALAFIVGLAGTLYDAQWLGSRTIHALADALIVAGIIGILL